MAYEKGFFTVSDHAVGKQCVNRALENNRALYEDQFDTNHSPGFGGGSNSDPFLSPGRHDDPLIARTVAHFSISSTGAVAIAIVSGPFLTFAAPVKLDTGQWRIYVNTPRLVKAYACIVGSTVSAPRAAMAYLTNDPQGPYVTVSTWNITGVTLGDYDFSLALFADAII